MVRAVELQSLGNALEALVNTKIENRSDLEKWYAGAQQVRQQIFSNPKLSNVVPHFVWHYLSDADIRFKDQKYAQLQREEIDRIILALKRGQVPVE